MKVYNTFINPGVRVCTFTEDLPVIEINFGDYRLLLTEDEAKALIEWIDCGLTKLSQIKTENITPSNEE